MILDQSIPMRKTVTPVPLANFSSVSGSDQNLNLSSLKIKHFFLKKGIYLATKLHREGIKKFIFDLRELYNVYKNK